METEIGFHIKSSSIRQMLESFCATMITHEIDSSTEETGSKLWDLSSDTYVAKVLVEDDNLEVLLLRLQHSRELGCSRLTEICLGILGNLYACPSARQALANQQNLQASFLDIIASTTETGPLAEALRAATAACNVQVSEVMVAFLFLCTRAYLHLQQQESPLKVLPSA